MESYGLPLLPYHEPNRNNFREHYITWNEMGNMNLYNADELLDKGV